MTDTEIATEHDGLDLELYFFTDVLGLASLHYGYWDQPPRTEDLTLASVREAQTRFTERLLSAIPPGVTSTLDVGSGIGDNAHAMAGRGLDVTALSPDRNHGKYYERKNGHSVSFHNLKFEDFHVDRTFDLVLMSESQNYFEPAAGLKQVRRYTKPGGWLLICGLFRKTASKELGYVPCIEGPYVEEARRQGFTLSSRTDITANVLPTLAYAERYMRPLLDLTERYLATASLPKRWLASLLIGKRGMGLPALRRYYQERADPAFFQAHARYLTLLFHRDDAAPAHDGARNGK